MVEWTLAELREAALGEARVWAGVSIRERVRGTLRHPIAQPGELPPKLETLIVVGGGSLIDRAKIWRKKAGLVAQVRLIAVPSIWGSGAEQSSVAVENTASGKSIELGPELVPDVFVYWPELAETIPETLARHACGDAWSHALEAFLSPLADDALRARLAELIGEMLELPIGKDPRWFSASGRACALQTRASVGLIHGIAHVIEPKQSSGHAALTSLLLSPVMAFNTARSSKLADLCGKHELSSERLLASCAALHDAGRWPEVLKLMRSEWTAILRDRCSRTNSTLVRPKDLEFFESFEGAAWRRS